MIEDLKAFCIVYIVTPLVKHFSANSKSIQNWKQKLIIWNDISSRKLSRLLNSFWCTIIILWLVCLYCSNKNLFFVSWVCFCIVFKYFVWNILTFCLNFRDQPWRCTYVGAKVAFVAGIFLKKYRWCMKIHFQFHIFAIWSISASILSITAWKAPASSWSPSELVMFFNVNPRCFGLFGKFQDTKEISM